MSRQNDRTQFLNTTIRTLSVAWRLASCSKFRSRFKPREDLLVFIQKSITEAKSHLGQGTQLGWDFSEMFIWMSWAMDDFWVRTPKHEAEIRCNLGRQPGSLLRRQCKNKNDSKSVLTSVIISFLQSEVALFVYNEFVVDATTGGFGKERKLTSAQFNTSEKLFLFCNGRCLFIYNVV